MQFIDNAKTGKRYKHGFGTSVLLVELPSQNCYLNIL